MGTKKSPGGHEPPTDDRNDGAGRAMAAGSADSGMHGRAMHAGSGMSGPPPTRAAASPAVDGIGPATSDGPATPDVPRRRCATMDVHRQLLNESDAYREARDAIEIATMVAWRPDAERFPGVAQIPVVVHVVYNTAAAEHLRRPDHQPDRRAEPRLPGDQPRRLDRARRRSAALVADTRIEFFLATHRPGRQPDDGHHPHARPRWRFFDADDKVKSRRDRRRRRLAGRPVPQHVGLPAARRAARLRPVPGRPGRDRRRGHHAQRRSAPTARPRRRSTSAARRPTRSVTTSTCSTSGATTAPAAAGPTRSPTRRTRAGGNIGVPTFPHVSCNNGPNGDLFVQLHGLRRRPGHGDVHPRPGGPDGGLPGRRPARSLAQVRRRPGAGRAGGRRGAPTGSTPSSSAPTARCTTSGGTASAWGPSVTGYEYMGGICMSAPEVASWGPNRLDAFVLGTDRALYHKWWDGVAWGPSVTGYEYLGGVCMSPPRVAAWGPNRLDVFVLGTDSALYHKWWDGSPGGRRSPATSTWAASASSPPEVVVVGPEPARRVRARHRQARCTTSGGTASSWGPSVTGYEYLGGVCASPPTVVAWGPNRLDVFVARHRPRALPQVVGRLVLGTVGHRLGVHGRGLHQRARGRRLVGPEPARRLRARHRPRRCTTSGGTARRGDRRSPDYEYMGGDHAPASRASWRGGRTGSTCSSPAPTARSTTSGGTARRGDRRSPATSTWAASSATSGPARTTGSRPAPADGPCAAAGVRVMAAAGAAAADRADRAAMSSQEARRRGRPSGCRAVDALLRGGPRRASPSTGPPDYDFPPARGRDGDRVRAPTARFVEWAIGRGDAPAGPARAVAARRPGRLHVTSDSGERDLGVVSLAADRLELTTGRVIMTATGCVGRRWPPTGHRVGRRAGRRPVRSRARRQRHRLASGDEAADRIGRPGPRRPRRADARDAGRPVVPGRAPATSRVLVDHGRHLVVDAAVQSPLTRPTTALLAGRARCRLAPSWSDRVDRLRRPGGPGRRRSCWPQLSPAAFAGRPRRGSPG